MPDNNVDNKKKYLSQNIDEVVNSIENINKFENINSRNIEKDFFYNFDEKNVITGLNQNANKNISNQNFDNNYIRKNIGNNFEDFKDEEDIPNVNFNKYLGIVHSNTTSNENIRNSNGIISINNKKYRVVPDEYFNMSDGTISESDYNNIVIKVANDMGLSDDEKYYSYDDALAIASVYFNRLESNNFTSKNNQYGNTISGILFEENGLNNKNIVNVTPSKLEIAQIVVNDLMSGVRNISKDTLYYVSNGVYNGFSQSIGGTTN